MKIQNNEINYNGSKQVGRSLKTIVWYDSFQKSMVGHSKRVHFNVCLFKACSVDYIINERGLELKMPINADAVLIQSGAIFTMPPPPRRDPNQVFVLGVRDSFYRLFKANNSKTGKMWLDRFNWTMSYRLDSDIIYGYSNIIAQQNTSHLQSKDYDEIYKAKERNIVWLVSHCQTKSKREDFVKDLETVIDVDIYGACGQVAPCPHGSQQCFDGLARKYKFYLAFENTFITDYITEKVFNWFNRDLIVVGRGGANYSRVLPPGTMIDASDFKSASELGSFLKELAADKFRYLAYLKQKDKYYSTGRMEAAQGAYCKLCKYLHTLESHHKTYDNIINWWLKGKIA